uniref:Uncharacterized protein n=1 Tax=Nymphaea colorata TaxID=210225 RepID=A0A5K1G5S5_9MAGN
MTLKAQSLKMGSPCENMISIVFPLRICRFHFPIKKTRGERRSQEMEPDQSLTSLILAMSHSLKLV